MYATHTANTWTPDTRMTPVHVDCTTAVMLKILDGKCKMNPKEKIVMESLYDAVRTLPGEILGADHHALIAQARATRGAALVEQVYEQRLYAEIMISRPVMKAYKAWLRDVGILPKK